MLWTIDLERRELRDAGGAHVALRRRSFALLLYLAQNHDRVVSKDELIEANWRGLAVTDDSLTQCIADIRRALGPERRDTVRTVAGRGYMLSGWHAGGDGQLLSEATGVAPVRPRGNLPPVPQLIGREVEIARLAALLQRERLVTVTGSGGVGKTSLSIAAAEGATPRFRDGVYFVGLASLVSAEPVPAAILRAVGAGRRRDAGDLIEVVRGLEALIVLDNCEHLIDPVAALVAELLASAPGLTVLATSREPLGVAGEHLFRLGTLDYPAAGEGLSAAAAMNHGAVALLCRRAGEVQDGFVLRDADVAAAVEVCARLDGIPLGIVLAAGRLGTMNLNELARQLDRRFELLGNGARSAEGRQRTLKAMVGWSVELLTPDERTLFAELGVFVGGATVDDIVGVCRVHGEPPGLGLILSLADKSLLNVQSDPAGPTRYSYFETTRHYALELLEAEPAHEVRRRHAAYLVALCQRAEAEIETRSLAEWRADYLRYLDNVRAALAWSLGPQGDDMLAVQLVAHSAEIFEELSLQAERIALLDRAMALPLATEHPALMGRMKLYRSFGTSWSVGDRHLVREAAELFRQSDEPFWEGRAWASEVVGLATAGDFAAAHESAARVPPLLEPSGNTRALDDFYRYLSLALMAEGRNAEAAAAVLRSKAIADTIGDMKGSLWARDGLAILAFARGDVAEAIALQRGSKALSQAMDSSLDVMFSQSYIAAWLLLSGERAGVLEELRPAIALGVRLQVREASVLHVALVALWLGLGARDEAEMRLAVFALGWWASREANLHQLERTVATVLRERLAAAEAVERRRAEADAKLWSVEQALAAAVAALDAH